jgi:hypothetical protein
LDHDHPDSRLATGPARSRGLSSLAGQGFRSRRAAASGAVALMQRYSPAPVAAITEGQRSGEQPPRDAYAPPPSTIE